MDLNLDAVATLLFSFSKPAFVAVGGGDADANGVFSGKEAVTC